MGDERSSEHEQTELTIESPRSSVNNMLRKWWADDLLSIISENV